MFGNLTLKLQSVVLVMKNHPVSLMKMMADFVYCMPVFPESKNLDYNYFKSFRAKRLQSRLSIENTKCSEI